MTGLRIKDIRNAAGRPVKINMGSNQYFLLVNHQGTAFDAKYPGTGLLIWHVIGGVAVDLESAYGKFDNIGPNQTPNPVSGMDLLEYDCTRLGGPEDFFDGSPDDFMCSTNPHTFLYNPGVYTDPQSTPTWLALENIQQDGSDILVDVSLTPQRVTAPNGGETKPVGQAVSITWNVRSNACVSTVDILLSTNGGSSFSNLATGETNDGTYSWTPSTLSTQNRVRIVSKNATPTAIGTDDSDADFTVWGPSGVTHSNVQAPEDSMRVDITWNTNVSTLSSGDQVVFYTSLSGSDTISPVSVTLTTSNGGLSHKAVCKFTPALHKTG